MILEDKFAGGEKSGFADKLAKGVVTLSALAVLGGVGIHLINEYVKTRTLRNPAATEIITVKKGATYSEYAF